MLTAHVFDLYRGTTHDGPGIRSTVFFAGCPLHCAWCHNPEGIPAANRVWWQAKSCIGCQLCVSACPVGAKVAAEDGILSTERCTACGACVRACPTGAMSFVWKEWSLEKLVDEVARDKPYYDRTDGGVTASGGECMLQASFVAAFFEQLHQRGITTALDTCGEVPWTSFETVLPHTDVVLYDLKLMDPEQHRHFTGADNALILENARRLVQGAREGKFRLWIRTPLIPEATATEENVHAVAAFLAKELKGAVERWELCAFNNHGLSKYERLHKPWIYANVPLLTAGQAEALRRVALECALGEENVAVTGMLSEG